MDCEQKQLALDLQRGRLVDVAEMADGFERAGRVIRSALKRHEEDGGQLVAASKDGVRSANAAIDRLFERGLAEISDALAREAKALRDAMA